MNRLLLLSFILILGCQFSDTQPLNYKWQEIKGRNEETTANRDPIYRAKVPLDWERVDSPLAESIVDTTKPLCEFYIKEKNGQVRITIHNFPVEKGNQRIPPLAQISRWKGQFDSLNPMNVQVTPFSHSGFIGFYIKAQGQLKDQAMSLLGWSMQLAPEHERQLNFNNNSIDKQRLSDYTIKALGPSELIARHQSAIVQFAKSFELIEELPAPL